MNKHQLEWLACARADLVEAKTHIKEVTLRLSIKPNTPNGDALECAKGNIELAEGAIKKAVDNVKVANFPINAFSLVELLVVIALIAVLAGILLPAVSNSFAKGKAWIWGIYSFNNQRIEAFLGDDDLAQSRFATNKPKPWNFAVSPSSTWYKP